jgi:DNA-binding GntR family transcriptional regulator
MRKSAEQQGVNHEHEAVLIVKKIRDAILDETFKPGDRLPEPELGKMFEVSRSPVREALFVLEREGTVVIEPFKGAIVKPLSPEEASDIAELRLALVTLAAKPAYRHLSPADFDHAYGLAKQLTRCSSAREHFNGNRQFWNMIFEKTQRPVLWEVFRQLDDRSTRYNPVTLKLVPNSAARPQMCEMFVELLKKGKVDEALRTFKKAYLEITHKVIESLRAQTSGRESRTAETRSFAP